MEDRLVSIIMPAHNAAEFIREAIESVIAQTYKHWELLVVNDASTDNTIDIIKEFCNRDTRITLLNNIQCVGMPSAPRNLGIQTAQGRYIAFLDSDDVWVSTKLEEQLPLFRNLKTAIVYSNYEKIDVLGRRNRRVVRAPQFVDYEDLLKSNVIGNLTGIYDRKKVGKVLYQNIHHEDYALWLSILKKGFVAQNTNTITGYYRIGKSSVSSHKFKLLPWQWYIYRNVEHLPWHSSIYYYIHYAIKGIQKLII
ncbi:MAG: glycosyltransferase [Bacteroidaceae bacterium]|nr:glycosyltransferase [Bacteroidaceae bacterium]